MIWICLALVAAWCITLSAAMQLARSERRQHARERDLMLNQLLNLAGKPWQPAPATTVQRTDDGEFTPAGWTWTPEQNPLG